MFSGQLPFRFVPCNLKNLCYNGVIILGGATMRIDQLDENLRIDTEITEPDLVWMDALRAPFALYGVFYDEEKGCYLRMPDAVAKTVSPGVTELNHHTAGGRIRFRTDSACIAIRAEMENNQLMSHITLIGQSGFDLYHRTPEGEDLFLQSFRPPMGMKTGFSSLVKTKGGLRDYTINFPLYDGVKRLYIALKKGSILEAPTPYRFSLPVVFYGSSITQGGCASRPGNSYQGILSRRLNVDHINLGFSGNGRAEPEMGRYLAGLDMQVFVCDYDYNCLSPEHLVQTHKPLFETVRSAHPDLPIILISAPTVIKEPEAYDGRRRTVKSTYDWAVEQGDKNVYYIDGGELLAGDCWDSCTVDGVHPNDFGFYRMAMRIEKTLKPILDGLK